MVKSTTWRGRRLALCKPPDATSSAPSSPSAPAPGPASGASPRLAAPAPHPFVRAAPGQPVPRVWHRRASAGDRSRGERRRGANQFRGQAGLGKLSIHMLLQEFLPVSTSSRSSSASSAGLSALAWAEKSLRFTCRLPNPVRPGRSPLFIIFVWLKVNIEVASRSVVQRRITPLSTPYTWDAIRPGTEQRGAGGRAETSLVRRSGWSRNRTGDTRIFSPLLYQLSYPAVRKSEGEEWRGGR